MKVHEGLACSKNLIRSRNRINRRSIWRVPRPHSKCWPTCSVRMIRRARHPSLANLNPLIHSVRNSNIAHSSTGSPRLSSWLPLEGGIGDAYVSPQIEAAWDSRRDEWLEDPIRWYQHIHPDDKERWSAEAAEMFVSGTPFKSVYRVIARDGRVVWFQCEASMLRREDGRPWAIQGVGFDITKLKESEQTLYEKNKQLELLKDVATTANQATTIAEAMQFAVERVCEFTGWPLGHACYSLRWSEASGLFSHLEFQPEDSFRCIPRSF